MNKLPQFTARIPQVGRKWFTAESTAHAPLYKRGVAVAVTVLRLRCGYGLKKNNLMNHDLFRYLLWGMTTTPARFVCLPDFEAWAVELGFDADQCGEFWAMVQAVPPARAAA
jgi:hypothetical protein